MLLLLSHQFLRNRYYEIFLRLHQALGILAAYGVWMHLVPRPLLPRLYNYISVGICGVTTLILCLLVLYRNGMFRRGFPRATLTSSKNSLLIQVALPFPVKSKGRTICEPSALESVCKLLVLHSTSSVRSHVLVR